MLRQKNLGIIVMDNASYQITGGQATSSAHAADFVAIARGAGIAKSAWAADESDFEQLVDRMLAEDGPSLIAARIDDKPAAGTTERDPMLIRDRFMRGLGVKK